MSPSSTCGCRRASATRASGPRSRRAGACPGTPILVLSQYVERQYATELLADGAGGVGYLLKDRVGDIPEFMDALRRVARGGTALDAEVVAQLMVRNRADDPLAALTPREREVLAAMAEGRTNVGIAQAPEHHRGRDREAHQQHLRQARAARLAERPPPRARGPDLPRASVTAVRGPPAAPHPEESTGISARTSGRAAGRARHGERPVHAGDAARQARQPATGLDRGAAGRRRPRPRRPAGSLAPAAHLAALRAAVLGDVREGLGDDEVGRPLDRRRQPLAGGELADDRPSARAPARRSTRSPARAPGPAGSTARSRARGGGSRPAPRAPAPGPRG